MRISTMSFEADGPTTIAIFASGSGSNALKIIEYFSDREDVKIGLVITNKPTAGVLVHAFKNSVPSVVLNTSMINDPEFLLPTLHNFEIDFIALAGFLLLIPEFLVEAYDGRIVNIHPALLPKYGGKGMYGMHVHRAVKEAGESVSGMTVHYVNKLYDEGAIIAQYTTALDISDSPEEIAAKVLKVEHAHYAPTIDAVIKSISHP